MNDQFNPSPRRSVIVKNERTIAPTPYRLPKNEQVSRLLTQLMKAEKFDIVKFEYDQSRSTCILYRVSNPGRKVRWELRNQKAFKLYGNRRSMFSRCKSLDDILDLLDGF